MPARTLVFQAFLGAIVVLAAADQAAAQAIPASQPCVEPDREYTSKFAANGPGWTGGDGAQSVPVGRRNVWIMADSFVGSVNQDGSRDHGGQMIRNAALLETPRGMRMMHPARSLLPTDREWDRWYWTGDGVYEDGEIRVPMYVVHGKPDGGWGFEIAGVSLARFSWPEMELIALERRPYNGVMWGLSIYEGRRWTYLYGWGESDKLYVARARAGELDGAWRYRTATGTWARRAQKAAPILTGATTASLAPYGDRFVLVTHRGVMSSEIAMHVSPTPYGPFDKGRVVYKTPEANAESFTYVATAHPQIEGDGLLIGYSVNGWKEETIFKDASVYRPRFVRADLDCLL